MSRSVEKLGKNVEEAVKSALLELGLKKEQVDIQVIEEGNKGFLGIGLKEAKVLVVEKNIIKERATEFLNSVFSNMRLDANINFEEYDGSLKINIEGDNMGILIGRRGETLDALQYLVSLVVNKGDAEFVRVSIDTENYRKKREQTLIQLAKKLADRVMKYRRSITLETMSSNERRIIHATLQNNKMISTYSVGEEPNRKVVIAFNNRKNSDI